MQFTGPGKLDEIGILAHKDHAGPIGELDDVSIPGVSV